MFKISYNFCLPIVFFFSQVETVWWNLMMWGSITSGNNWWEARCLV